MRKPGIESIDFVVLQKAAWDAGKCIPLSMKVCEYLGDGDPAFGGHADDRMLGPDGEILDRGFRENREPMNFLTIEEAHEAAKKIKNRRPGSILGICTNWI